MPLPSDNTKGRVRSVAVELFRDLGTVYFVRLQATLGVFELIWNTVFCTWLTYVGNSV